MSIEYTEDLPDKHRFYVLFESTGWNSTYRASVDELAASIGHNWYALAAYDGPQLVGFGRVDSDGSIHAMIFDLIVAPEYQGLGIGRTILSRLVDRCRRAGIRDVQLFCSQGNIGFYERHGFVARPADAPGMELRRNSEDDREGADLPG